MVAGSSASGGSSRTKAALPEVVRHGSRLQVVDATTGEVNEVDLSPRCLERRTSRMQRLRGRRKDPTGSRATCGRLATLRAQRLRRRCEARGALCRYSLFTDRRRQLGSKQRTSYPRNSPGTRCAARRRCSSNACSINNACSDASNLLPNATVSPPPSSARKE